MHYLGNEQEFQKVGEVGPPLKLKINWGLLTTIFQNFDLLWSKMDFFDFLGHFSKAFSLETIDFCEKSFSTAVSRYNMSHMTRMTHTFEKKGATLVVVNKVEHCNQT